MGELPGKSGTWVGVELFDSWDAASAKFLGDNDGTYKNPTTFVSTRMFTCERLCGLFVPIVDVAPSTDFDSPPSPSHPADPALTSADPVRRCWVFCASCCCWVFGVATVV